MSDTTAIPKPSDIAKFLANAHGVDLPEAPVPVAQPTEETPVPDPAPVEAEKPKTPWNDTDNPYDADRAAQLIENLRVENKRLREERDTVARNVQPDRVAQLEQEIGRMRAQLLNADRATALAAANLPADMAQFITATTADGIKEQVQKLASLRGEAVPQTLTGAGVPGFADPALSAPPNVNESLGAKLMRQFGV